MLIGVELVVSALRGTTQVQEVPLSFYEDTTTQLAVGGGLLALVAVVVVAALVLCCCACLCAAAAGGGCLAGAKYLWDNKRVRDEDDMMEPHWSDWLPPFIRDRDDFYFSDDKRLSREQAHEAYLKQQRKLEKKDRKLAKLDAEAEELRHHEKMHKKSRKPRLLRLKPKEEETTHTVTKDDISLFRQSSLGRGMSLNLQEFNPKVHWEEHRKKELEEDDYKPHHKIKEEEKKRKKLERAHEKSNKHKNKLDDDAGKDHIHPFVGVDHDHDLEVVDSKNHYKQAKKHAKMIKKGIARGHNDESTAIAASKPKRSYLRK